MIAIRQPASRMGLILAGAGFIWFAGNFSALPAAVVAAVASQLTLTHRAVLMHAALAVPGGRLAGPSQLGTVVVAYLVWSVPVVATMPVVSIGLGVVVTLVAAMHLLSAPPSARRARLVGLAATVLLGGAFALASVVHAGVPGGEADRVVLLIDQASVVVAVIALTVATLSPRLRAMGVTDVLVQASRPRWVRFGRRWPRPWVAAPWRSATGTRPPAATWTPPARPSPCRRETIPRSVLRIDYERAPAAVLVHDPAALESRSLVDAVRAATALAAANVRLRGSILDQLADVRASRRRLVLAADAELARLERRIDSGPLQRVHDLDASSADMESAAAAGGATAVADHLARARVTLGTATDELAALARGLHPTALLGNGLASHCISWPSDHRCRWRLHAEAGALPRAGRAGGLLRLSRDDCERRKARQRIGRGRAGVAGGPVCSS